MKIVYLLLSNFEYIGLLLMMLSLISDVKITRDIRKWIGRGECIYLQYEYHFLPVPDAVGRGDRSLR